MPDKHPNRLGRVKGKGKPPEHAKRIAKHPGQSGRTPMRQIRAIIKLIGIKTAWALVQQAESIEAESGQVVVAEGATHAGGNDHLATLTP